MASDSPIIPNLGKNITKAIKKVQPKESVGEKEDKAWAEFGRYPGWKNLLKPYLEDRIASLKMMTEVKLDGTESVSEVGARFLIFSGIARELQFVIDKVDKTREILDKKDEEERKKTEEKIRKSVKKKGEK